MLGSLRLYSLALLVTFTTFILASKQVSAADSESDAPTIAPVAFVYISSMVSAGTFEISAYSASSQGQLTLIQGSPFHAGVSALVANKKFLFGTNGVDIASFTIASDGSLNEVATINAQNLNQNGCGGPENLFLDNTGATLYDPDYLGNICANNAYQSFSVDVASGSLNYLGSAVASPAFNSPLSFIGNNIFGYSSSCFRFSPTIFGYKRGSDTTLSQLNMNPQIPTAPSGKYYCTYLAAADGSNHVVIPMLPLDFSWQTAGPAQLAVYTAGSSGNLITTSTSANMPKAAFAGVTDIRISPSGKFVAVSGTTGAQIFHFNGANPITHFTGVLANHQVDHLFWDENDHLYAICNAVGKLYVYTVGDSVAQAPGSPYSITSPQSIAVLSKP